MSISFCCLAASFDPALEVQFLVDGPAVDGCVGQCAAVILPTGDETRAEVLLAAGARQVLIGEAALLDSGVIERLVARYGKERIGLAVPVRNLAVDWAFETVSNADFKVVTPSICEPTWEVLRADGSGTGTHAEWWIGQMVERGAHTVLLLADIDGDGDLNLCAGLVEKLGGQLWVAPRASEAPPLADWIAFGQVKQLALPPALYRRRDEWQCPAATNESVEAVS
ncbi:MAG: hypothetical protein CVU33_12810 [Betaproteobacteria bacterium HGW-Betaproteobacteria-6]|jgi:hypothetical protein|nr:MAG: hypothetical protein CVU33_12810 [Betaproteobacteria bacterium HGW-Betaproteobacteria-6]